MNLPYTMTVESAVDAVLEFKPKKVYPYHYRGKDGLSNVESFKNTLNKLNKSIEVIQWNWYPSKTKRS
jgi:L-ascorbate metabolism protein UlaG (beta-lactamase superfamily)